MPTDPHSPEAGDQEDLETEEPSNDPRNNSDASYDAMVTSTIDSAHNMPGDQPEDDTPPPRGRATGDEEPLHQ